MRFMMRMIPKGYETAAPGTVPDAKAVEAMMTRAGLPRAFRRIVSRAHSHGVCPAILDVSGRIEAFLPFG